MCQAFTILKNTSTGIAMLISVSRVRFTPDNSPGLPVVLNVDADWMLVCF